MNEAALGSFIESGDQFPNFRDVGFGRAANALPQCAQACVGTAVVRGAGKRLSSAFRCRFRVSHFLLNWATTVAQPVKMSRCRYYERAELPDETQLREREAILT